MTNDITDVITLQENPKLYVRTRSERLIKLVELDAPYPVIENELKLVMDAIYAYHDWIHDKRRH